jgi:hypothetical protein
VCLCKKNYARREKSMCKGPEAGTKGPGDYSVENEVTDGLAELRPCRVMLRKWTLNDSPGAKERTDDKWCPFLYTDFPILK